MKELLARFRNWRRQAVQDFERTRPIVLCIRIPFTPDNEKALREMTVGNLLSSMEVTFPVTLEQVEVRCIQNPDWRS